MKMTIKNLEVKVDVTVEGYCEGSKYHHEEAQDGTINIAGRIEEISFDIDPSETKEAFAALKDAFKEFCSVKKHHEEHHECHKKDFVSTEEFLDECRKKDETKDQEKN